MSKTDVIITVKDLVFEYPNARVLHNINFSLNKGSITALVGPNGAGKTTLMRCMAALQRPYSGTIKVCGVDTQDDPRRVHEHIGYLSDFFGLYDDLKVEQCLSYAAAAQGMEEVRAQEAVKWSLKIMGLEPRKDQLAGSLSRGWRQRLGVAQAIIHKPDVLILDEPASGLDPEARMILSQIFKTLREEGMSLLVSSHILAELEDYCTEMLVIRNGKIKEHIKLGEKETEKPKTEVRIQLAEMCDEDTLKKIEKTRRVQSVLKDGENSLTVLYEAPIDELPALLKKLVSLKLSIISFVPEKQTLQSAYMALANDKEPKQEDAA